MMRIKGEVVSVHAMKAYRGTGGINPLILNLNTRWEVSGKLRARQFYSQERKPVSIE
jgi:hypothetical protein